MNEEQRQLLIAEAIRIRFAIFNNGGMATKSIVEDVLMERHKVSRYDAHMVMNDIESGNLDMPHIRRRRWVGEDPTPVLSDYPELRNMNVRGLTF